MDERTDDELWAMVDSNPSAFRVVYDRWADRLLRYFYRRTFDAEASADLLAETFAVAYLKRKQFRPGRGTMGPWLHGIAGHELDHYRRRRAVELRALEKLGVERPTVDDESYTRIEELADVEAYRSHLAAALDLLSEGQREAVRLRVVEDLPYVEVARRLDCSEGAARVRVHRALQTLADSLEAPA